MTIGTTTRPYSIDNSSSSSSSLQSPSTPPRVQRDLLTPPSSHIEKSSTTQPPLGRSRDSPELYKMSVNATLGKGGGVEPTPLDTAPNSSQSQSPMSTSDNISTDQSPSVVAQSRMNQTSGAKTNTTRSIQEPLAALAAADETIQASPSYSQISRTPSPVLGSFAQSSGRLAFGAALEPSAEEVRSLLYGDAEDVEHDQARPSDLSKQDMDQLLTSINALGIAESSQASKETQLAEMVKKLVKHSQKQEQFIDGLEENLHNTRIRSISILSSLRTSFAHTFASEHHLRARLEAELEGSKQQARKLSQLLSRSESRNEELDRERAKSAEEEYEWQEQMKNHASAYAQQQAARAHAAQRAQRGGSSGRLGAADVSAKNEGQDGAPLEGPSDERNPSSSPANKFPQSVSDSALAGLGISSSATPAHEAHPGSPLSVVLKERNKLRTDKQHLKARMREAEAQRDRLENELKSMRSLLVRPSKSVVASQLNATPATPGKSAKRDRNRRRRHAAVMGDAEAEHLLLAARRLQNTRNAGNDADGAKATTPPPTGAGQPRTPKTPRVYQTPRSGGVLESVIKNSAAEGVAANASPLAGREEAGRRWGGHQRQDSARSTGGIDDLLQAAQTVLTPSERQRQLAKGAAGAGTNRKDGIDAGDHGKGDASISADITASTENESPKRRRVSNGAQGMEAERRRSEMVYVSPDKASAFNAGRRLRVQTEGGEMGLPSTSQSSQPSALDLLADQAAASQQPSQTSERSQSDERSRARSFDSDDGMNVDEAPTASHFYPRGSYGHPYAHPATLPPPMHEAYHHRMPGQAAYYPPHVQGSPVGMSNAGWTSQNVGPPGMSGTGNMYSPTQAQHGRFAMQPGMRLSTGYVTNMHDGSRLAKMGQSPMGMNEGFAMYDDEDAIGGPSGGGNGKHTPHKGGNQNPDKRLPYVRWSEDEDSKLRRAIAEFGQRWESVAKVVGTRTYHQCRQRYLLMRRKEAAAREEGNIGQSRSAGGGSGDESAGMQSGSG